MTNTKFKFDILENTEEGIVQVGEKEVYNLDGGEVGLNSFVQRNHKNYIDFPGLSSCLKIAPITSYCVNKSIKNQIGYILLRGNLLEYNDSHVGLYTSVFSNLHGVHIEKSNYRMLTDSFCARRLIPTHIYNGKDEYMKPSDNTLASEDYLQWSNDCLIYSLFDNQSFQSSLRQITYQGKQWDIKNQFFPFSSQGQRTLAENHQFIEMIDDLDEDDSERFVYTEIERIKSEAITFSQEALDVLDSFKSLVEASMPQRKLMHSQHEEYHLHAWDCGYAQCKIFLKEHFAKEFKAFDILRKALADKLRPKVYEFGFLYK